MIDYAAQVLASIIPHRRDHLLTAMQKLDPEHFPEGPQRNLFVLLGRYYDVAAGIMPLETLSDMLHRSSEADDAKILLYEQMYTELVKKEVSDHEFRFAMSELKEIRSELLTNEALATAEEILSAVQPISVDKVDRKGHADARNYLYSELARIERLGNVDEAPEGDIRLELAEVIKEYADTKAGTGVGGIKSGIPAIDETTGGFQSGELILISGYAGVGKSMLATQIAWHAATQQGKNVLFFTSETVRITTRRRLIARHSRSPIFDLPEGLDASRIKKGTLDPSGEDALKRVMADLANNASYGRMYVSQVPHGCTLGFLESRMRSQQAQWQVDLVIIDYLMLLRPDRKRQSSREELNDILRDTKVLAATFDAGRGIPIISPWAMSRSAYKEAMQTGEYGLDSLAETSEAEKAADQIISLLRFPDQPNEVKVEFLKQRDGEIPKSFVLETDYRCCYLGVKTTADAVQALLEEDFV